MCRARSLRRTRCWCGWRRAVSAAATCTAFDGSTGRRIPPLVMGHEAAGVVAQTGAAVRDFHAGDRVTFDSTI